MIPILVLSIFWFILSILVAFDVTSWWVTGISFLTFAQGGMYGGLLGVIGGIIGIACLLMS
ncbi:MAG: hypothetical protein GX829_07505 [Clostridium sp.]|nr:hypothetical protein [Clostridium sp.]